MTSQSITDRIKAKAREIGFDLVGITNAEPHADIAIFDQWLDKDFDATMAYLERRRDDRANPRRLLPTAQSIICCGLNYYGGEPHSQEITSADHAWISRYAWGDDYHEVVLSKLQELEQFIHDEIDAQAKLKAYVDTGPILERSLAARAGLGWIGKNTLLINRQVGSFFFIGEILCSLDLSNDAPATDHCGHCTLCIDSCPTNALTPYELDSNRCISYLTIEHRGEIPQDLQSGIGKHLVGCDICQEVCPWNQAIPLSAESSFKPREGLFRPDLKTLNQMDEQNFRETFRRSAVKRTKWAGFKRNLDNARRNSND